MARLETNAGETPLDPAQPIIDAHHHLYDRPGLRYLLDEFGADLDTGHDVRATVFVQARAAYRPDGPEALHPVGETEFATAIAERAPADGPRINAAIVAHADLMRGDAVVPVLEAHAAAAPGRLRGIRHITAWDSDPALLNAAYPSSDDMMASPAFRAGFARLAEFGLSFDAWVYFPQLPRLADLARAHPEVPVIVDHCGGVLGAGRYRGARDAIFARWRDGLRLLADCPNVSMKLGGLGMAISGFGFESARAPSSSELAAAWAPWIETCVEIFGASRCMFESNYPADRGSHAYATGWNAMKRLAAGASPGERNDLFWRNAARVYRIDMAP